MNLQEKNNYLKKLQNFIKVQVFCKEHKKFSTIKREHKGLSFFILFFLQIYFLFKKQLLQLFIKTPISIYIISYLIYNMFLKK